jgi:FkbM family methyltransferase
MDLTAILPLDNKIHVADVGAADLGEKPPYSALLQRGLMRLSAFDGDERHKARLLDLYKDDFRFYGDIIADGKDHTMYVTQPSTGMSSILKPSKKHLEFFNGFSAFGEILREMKVKSKRLDDIEDLDAIDYLKIDVQGAELMVMKNGRKKLAKCVVVHTEVSFTPLYEGQACSGEVDVWLRSQGFFPHSYEFIKKWSIFPKVRENNFRVAYNQLLEADIVYVRDPFKLDELSVDQLKKLAYITNYCYGSPDMAEHVLIELRKRGAVLNAPQGPEEH